ncbi:MAG TPA: hypothetical protein VKB05_09525 [Pyrinomonadaceae bacterium]|nr:hypothetical protein [Pyrinomonadaceae bacterium]
MIFLRLVAVGVVLLVVASCRSQNESLTNTTPSPETIVSSTPPFQTKEPERYRAVRTITASADGRTVVTRAFVARDGQLRRYETTGTPKTTILLDTPEGKFFLLPDEKVYADFTDQSRISADKNEEGLESSPDALLHTDAESTSYQKLGNEVIAGRNTNKYRIVVNSSTAPNVSQSETLMWIDEALQMPIRSETKSDGTHVTMEISEIKLEVDKSLFTIPEGYQKVSFDEFRRRLTPE